MGEFFAEGQEDRLPRWRRLPERVLQLWDEAARRGQIRDRGLDLLEEKNEMLL